MQKTLLELLSDMAMHLNGDATPPADGTDEYVVWKRALNKAQDVWSDSDYDFKELRATYRATVLQSGCSLALPIGFVKMFDSLKVDGVEAGFEIDLNEKWINFNPLTNISAIEYPYRSKPSSLTTLTQMSQCPSDNFLVDKATEIVLFDRENSRYQKFRDDADLAMAQMIGTQVHERGQDTSVKNTTAVKSGFVLGRD